MYVNELIRFFNSSKSAQIKISLWEELKRIKLSGEKYCSLSNSDIEKERIKYLLWLIEKFKMKYTYYIFLTLFIFVSYIADGKDNKPISYEKFLEKNLEIIDGVFPIYKGKMRCF
jgi:hypothetical protein